MQRVTDAVVALGVHDTASADPQATRCSTGRPGGHKRTSAPQGPDDDRSVG
jgi:hypothetical protein